MHVLLIPSWYAHLRSAGGGSFFRDQAQALAAAGHKVGLIYPKLWGLRDYRTGPLPDMNRIRTEDDGAVRVWRIDTLHRLPRVPFRDACKFTAAGMRLFDAYVAAEGRPDILHAHAALYGGVLARRAAARSGIPFVLTEHSTDFAQGKYRWWQKRLVAGDLVSGAAASKAGVRILGTTVVGSAWAAYWSSRISRSCGLTARRAAAAASTPETRRFCHQRCLPWAKSVECSVSTKGTPRRADRRLAKTPP